MFVYFSFSPANVFHQTSVSRYVLAGGYKQCVHTVFNSSLPAFSAVRLSCSLAGRILWVLSADNCVCQPPPLLFKAQPDIFLSPQVKAKPCQAAGVQLPVRSLLSHQSSPIQPTIVISWNRYTITGNLILEQSNSKKSVDKGARRYYLLQNAKFMCPLNTAYAVLIVKYMLALVASSSDFSVPGKKRGVKNQKQALGINFQAIL